MPSNWFNGEPTSSDIASINNGGTALITGNNEACGDLFLGSGSSDGGTLDMTSGSLGVYSNLRVGDFGCGTLKISDGYVFIKGYSVIGNQSNSTGEVSVDGPGSTWTNRNSFYVGNYGNGTLNITNGGAVSNEDSYNYCGYIGSRSGSTGEVRVDGSGSKWTNNDDLYVGREGIGALNITSGGTVSSYDGHIGDESGSTGEVTVDGSGSKWTNSRGLDVGNYGNGTLNITSGGVIRNSYGHIGHQSGSTGEVTVNGSGSKWENGALDVGYSGNGTLSITSGGAVSSSYSHIGNQSSSTGEVTVDGSGSIWTNSDLEVGHYGNGTLNITSGGVIRSSYCHIGHLSGSTGEVTVDGSGSTWTNENFFYVGLYGNGTLNITNGGAVNNGNDAYIGCWSNWSSTGEVTVDGSGSTWTNSDDLYVGREDDGTLNITTDGLVSIAGTLTIDDDGDDDSFINMSTGGMLALFGNADANGNDDILLTEFMNMIDGTDAIRYWDNSISDWADITDATYCRDYTLSYLTEGDLAGYTLLTVKLAMDGDANGDGNVDVSDLGILAANYGASGCDWEHADFTDDGMVNVSDLGILATYYGSTAATAAQSVPEPGTLMLLATCGLALLSLDVRRRKR